MAAGRLGMIATPAQGQAIPGRAVWCADNGCYGKGYPGDAAWVAWLDSYPPELRQRAAFATAPDVVGDARATLDRSAPWLSVIRSLGYPAALVAQDGLEALPVPWSEFDVLFIGGSTAWKVGAEARRLVEDAKARGIPVHMGRVNSGRRLLYARAIGCTSVDGTHLTFRPNVYLPQVLGWCEQAKAPTIFDMIES